VLRVYYVRIFYSGIYKISIFFPGGIMSNMCDCTFENNGEPRQGTQPRDWKERWELPYLHAFSIRNNISALVQDLKCTKCGSEDIKIIMPDPRYTGGKEEYVK
jgi:hypothetical protein